MSVPAAYLPVARDDLQAAFQYHEQQQAGLGTRFVVAVEKLVNRLCDNPQLYGRFRRDIRAAFVQIFPYVVYYRDRGSDILIIAIQHGRRKSNAWRGRV